MMVSWFDFVILALATWRLSHMVSIEDGPGLVFHRLRVRAGAFKTIKAEWLSDTFLGQFLICPLCVSVWIALILYLVSPILPGLWFVVVILAISGLASLLQLIIDR